MFWNQIMKTKEFQGIWIHITPNRFDCWHFLLVTSIHSVKLRFAYKKAVVRKNKHILQMLVKIADESHGRILKNYFWSPKKTKQKWVLIVSIVRINWVTHFILWILWINIDLQGEVTVVILMIVTVTPYLPVIIRITGTIFGHQVLDFTVRWFWIRTAQLKTMRSTAPRWLWIFPPNFPGFGCFIQKNWRLTAKIESTPRKINMEPENTPLEKENHLPNHHFQVLC